MNIFALSSDPTEAAQFNASRHVIKLITEVSQLLSSAHRVLDGVLTEGYSKSGRRQKIYDHPNTVLYKATHINHPSAKYCRDSAEQYMWAAKHLKALAEEYTYRYGKIHKSERTGMVDFFLNNIPKNIGNKSAFELPYPAMPDDVVIKGDVVESYRSYYRKYKRHIASWKGKVNSRSVPDWYA